MYDAVRHHDGRYDGVFYFSAENSEVYCVPSCTVRTPLRRNAVFFLTEADARVSGRRPCMRCRPDLVPVRRIADVGGR